MSDEDPKLNLASEGQVTAPPPADESHAPADKSAAPKRGRAIVLKVTLQGAKKDGVRQTKAPGETVTLPASEAESLVARGLAVWAKG